METRNVGNFLFFLVILFKSYYVVWKPRRNETEIYDGESLNRTM